MPAPQLEKRPRGFALVIVVICSVAMVAIALALVFTAGANKLVSIKGSAIDQSETIAVAGLERAVAYAERVAEVERDFDRLLDPTESISCLSAVSAQTSPQENGSGLPRFSDGTAVTYEGRDYRLVPFNAGAYLVRFDDDADDSEDNPRLAPFTSNRPGSGCLEGPAFTQGNNPFRDRNRSVWISVVGIYPGTNPAAARHRTALRRFHISTVSLPGPAIHVKGNITFSGDLRFCSNVGDISSGGNIAFSGGDEVCGRTTAAGNVTGPTPTSAFAACPTACTPPSTPLPSSPFVEPFEQPPLTAANFGVDRAPWFKRNQRSCNFYVLRDPAVGGLFFWDSTVGGPGSPCETLGSAITDTLPTPANIGEIVAPPSGQEANRCWVPLLVTTAAGVTLDPLGFGEQGGDDWVPTTSAQTRNLASGTVIGGATVTLGYSSTKPDWRTCTTPWKGVSGGAFGCGDGTPGCNDVTPAATAAGTGTLLRFHSTTALPAGNYRMSPGNETASRMFTGSSAPATDITPDDWGLGTFIVDGNFLADTDAALGYGQEHTPYASLVVKDNIDFTSSSKMAFAGSLVSLNGNITFANGSGVNDFRFHGMIIAGQGNLSLGSGAKLHMHYDQDLFGGTRAVPASPTTSRTIR